MAIGPQTFIYDMLSRAGFTNLVKEPRYPELFIEELENLSPDYLLLISEPFAFKQNHIEEFAAHLPNTQVHVVDVFLVWEQINFGQGLFFEIDFKLHLLKKIQPFIKL
ncbi:helical backbone metal receptor [Cecembia rubra]|uniref:helical backbone metal receptor n=1 Tax=Cecembia rubra TaxID=1485585 RepID=UPI0027153E74|nr:helical backbone metal receptor [Cecembia rubra]